MDTKRKTVLRLSELDELRRRLQEPLTATVRERRQRLREPSDRFLSEMAPVPGDVKDWIRKERGEIKVDPGVRPFVGLGAGCSAASTTQWPIRSSWARPYPWRLIKRPMFGWAKLDVLRCRVLEAVERRAPTSPEPVRGVNPSDRQCSPSSACLWGVRSSSTA